MQIINNDRIVICLNILRRIVKNMSSVVKPTFFRTVRRQNIIKVLIITII